MHILIPDLRIGGGARDARTFQPKRRSSRPAVTSFRLRRCRAIPSPTPSREIARDTDGIQSPGPRDV